MRGHPAVLPPFCCNSTACTFRNTIGQKSALREGEDHSLIGIVKRKPQKPGEIKVCGGYVKPMLYPQNVTEQLLFSLYCVPSAEGSSLKAEVFSPSLGCARHTAEAVMTPALTEETVLLASALHGGIIPFRK